MTNGPNTDQEVSASVSNLAGVWQPIETAPRNTPIMMWVGGRYGRVAFGQVYDFSGKEKIQPDGWLGDFSDEVHHWMPVPTAPE
jgi:hypothetical protein